MYVRRGWVGVGVWACVGGCGCLGMSGVCVGAWGGACVGFGACVEACVGCWCCGRKSVSFAPLYYPDTLVNPDTCLG